MLDASRFQALKTQYSDYCALPPDKPMLDISPLLEELIHDPAIIADTNACIDLQYMKYREPTDIDQLLLLDYRDEWNRGLDFNIEKFTGLTKEFLKFHYAYSMASHLFHKRKKGDVDYFVHAEGTADEASEERQGYVSIALGLLHDLAEVREAVEWKDTGINKEERKKKCQIMIETYKLHALDWIDKNVPAGYQDAFQYAVAGLSFALRHITKDPGVGEYEYYQGIHDLENLLDDFNDDFVLKTGIVPEVKGIDAKRKQYLAGRYQKYLDSQTKDGKIFTRQTRESFLRRLIKDKNFDQLHNGKTMPVGPDGFKAHRVVYLLIKGRIHTNRSLAFYVSSLDKPSEVLWGDRTLLNSSYKLNIVNTIKMYELRGQIGEFETLGLKEAYFSSPYADMITSKNSVPDHLKMAYRLYNGAIKNELGMIARVYEKDFIPDSHPRMSQILSPKLAFVEYAGVMNERILYKCGAGLSSHLKLSPKELNYLAMFNYEAMEMLKNEFSNRSAPNI